MRKNSRELPDGSELAKILAQEAKRKLPPGKMGVHYPDFSLAIKLLAAYGESDLFQGELKAEEFIEKAKAVVNMMTKMILSDKAVQEKKVLFEMAYDYLSEEDKPLKADLIFVFGSTNPDRAKKAVELYKKGLAPKILFSGRSPIYDPGRPAEAQEYRQLALEQGVPDRAIIVEDESVTIADNIKRSLNLLDKLEIKFEKIILVNSPSSQRRGWCHFRKYLPDKIKLFRTNCLARQECAKINWFKNELGIKTILNEFIKMKVSVILDTA